MGFEPHPPDCSGCKNSGLLRQNTFHTHINLAYDVDYLTSFFDLLTFNNIANRFLNFIDSEK